MLCAANGYCRLVDDHQLHTRCNPVRDFLRCCVYVLEVCIAVRLGRRADGDDDDSVLFERRDLCGEADVGLFEKLFQAPLVDRGLATGKTIDYLGVLVNAGYVVPQETQSSAGGKANVASANDGDVHSLILPKRWWVYRDL